MKDQQPGYNASEQLKADHAALKRENTEQFDEILPIEGIDDPPLEIPGIGRIVYLFGRDALAANAESNLGLYPIPSIVVAANGPHDTKISVYPFCQESFSPDPRPSRIWTIDHISAKLEDDDKSRYVWDWMPYQKGQLKKLEEVQAIEWPGLRSIPTKPQLENRFTYHPPKPDQPEKYTQIRKSAKELACLLCAFCPASPELASALDHLDTVVFKANAAIARHS